MLDRRFLDINLTVIGIANKPKDNPVKGDQYIVGSSPEGAFAGFTANNLVRYNGSEWIETPKDSNTLEVFNLETGYFMHYDSTAEAWSNLNEGAASDSDAQENYSLSTIIDIANQPYTNIDHQKGDQYIVGYYKSGAFNDFSYNDLVQYNGSKWVKVPITGKKVEVLNIRTGLILRYKNSRWDEVTTKAKQTIIQYIFDTQLGIRCINDFEDSFNKSQLDAARVGTCVYYSDDEELEGQELAGDLYIKRANGTWEKIDKPEKDDILYVWDEYLTGQFLQYYEDAGYDPHTRSYDVDDKSLVLYTQTNSLYFYHKENIDGTLLTPISENTTISTITEVVDAIVPVVFNTATLPEGLPAGTKAIEIASNGHGKLYTVQEDGTWNAGVNIADEQKFWVNMSTGPKLIKFPTLAYERPVRYKEIPCTEALFFNKDDNSLYLFSEDRVVTKTYGGVNYNFPYKITSDDDSSSSTQENKSIPVVYDIYDHVITTESDTTKNSITKKVLNLGTAQNRQNITRVGYYFARDTHSIYVLDYVDDTGNDRTLTSYELVDGDIFFCEVEGAFYRYDNNAIQRLDAFANLPPILDVFDYFCNKSDLDSLDSKYKVAGKKILTYEDYASEYIYRSQTAIPDSSESGVTFKTEEIEGGAMPQGAAFIVRNDSSNKGPKLYLFAYYGDSNSALGGYISPSVLDIPDGAVFLNHADGLLYTFDASTKTVSRQPSVFIQPVENILPSYKSLTDSDIPEPTSEDQKFFTISGEVASVMKLTHPDSGAEVLAWPGFDDSEYWVAMEPGKRYASLTDHKIYYIVKPTYDAAYTVSETLPDYAIFLNKADGCLYVYDTPNSTFIKVAGGSGSGAATSSVLVKTEVHTLTEDEATEKCFELSKAIATDQNDNVLVFISGVAQAVGVDFYVDTDDDDNYKFIAWDKAQYKLYNLGLHAGDLFIVQYYYKS